ncbi:hypothetical protein pb186bvf_008375 [Paramecium bursaria]
MKLQEAPFKRWVMIKLVNKIQVMSNRNTIEELKKFTGMDQKPQQMMSLYQIPSLLDLDGNTNKFLSLEPLELYNEKEFEYTIAQSVKKISSLKKIPMTNQNVEQQEMMRQIIADNRMRTEKSKALQAIPKKQQPIRHHYIYYLLVIIFISLICI